MEPEALSPPLADRTLPIIPYYYSDRCGAGKTHHILMSVATNPGRYIIAVDRKAVIEERVEIIRANAVAAGLRPPMIEIAVSGNQNDGANKGVASTIADTVARNNLMEHAIVFVAQAGLKMTDYTTFPSKRWHLIVDETPDLMEIKMMDTGPYMTGFLRENYTIDDDGVIEPKRAIPAREFKRDTMKAFKPFHDMVKKGSTIASVRTWDETADQGWYVSRLWDVGTLDMFQSVGFFADSFEETITYNIMAGSGVVWEKRELDDPRQWADRPVLIRYFADDHAASSYRFKQEAMKDRFAAIAAYMTANNTEDHLWTVSDVLRPHFSGKGIPGNDGETVTPKLAGSNAWTGFNNATIIYTSRPNPAEIMIYQRYGMDERKLRRARQGYDIKQFSMRLSLRDPRSTVPVTITLYDLKAATELKKYLDATYGFDCQLDKIDIGITKPVTKAAKPDLTPQEKRERQRAYNAKNYAKRKARLAA